LDGSLRLGEEIAVVEGFGTCWLDGIFRFEGNLRLGEEVAGIEGFGSIF